ncbi:MAG: ABC transporter permease, partial [Pseudomonadota bacterium]
MNARPLALRLAGRELRHGAAALWVFIAAIALGVGAIAAVGSLSAAFLKGLEDESRRILGGDLEVTVTHGTLPDAARAALGAMGTVSEIADAQVMAFAAEGGASTVVQLKGVDEAYPLIGAVGLSPATPLENALSFGAAVDQALLERLDLKLGDEIRIGEAAFPVLAVLEEEPDRAAAG